MEKNNECKMDGKPTNEEVLEMVKQKRMLL